jgi:hypothetical protein
MHMLDVYRTEMESEIQRSKSVGVGGPQAPRHKDTKIVVIKACLSASHPILDFYFLVNIFMLRMIVH